jgi:hypothetical protein
MTNKRYCIFVYLFDDTIPLPLLGKTSEIISDTKNHLLYKGTIGGR